MPRKHAHYFRSVAHLNEVDVYRVLELFNVTDQALGHAIKKLLAPGGRGAGKDFRKDVQEAIDTLTRRLEMLDEDATAGTGKVCQITPLPPAESAPAVIPPPPEYDPASVAFAGAQVDADGWIKWEGGECPVRPDTRVHVQLRNGRRLSEPAFARRLIWRHVGDGTDIIAYRVVRD